MPEAYFKQFGQKLHVFTLYPELWINNPYCIIDHSYDGYMITFEDFGNDPKWGVYRPQRIFQELTGVFLPRESVNPKLYYPKNPHKKRLVICDEAGWETRKGYAHFDKLAKILQNNGWEIHLVHNRPEPKEVNTFNRLWTGISLTETIELIATAELYIGYDSGLAHIAGALDVPYVMICGSTPPIVARHQSCIFALEICDHCKMRQCELNCLANSPNANDEIIRYIIRSYYAT